MNRSKVYFVDKLRRLATASHRLYSDTDMARIREEEGGIEERIKKLKVKVELEEWRLAIYIYIYLYEKSLYILKKE